MGTTPLPEKGVEHPADELAHALAAVTEWSFKLEETVKRKHRVEDEYAVLVGNLRSAMFKVQELLR